MAQLWDQQRQEGRREEGETMTYIYVVGIHIVRAGVCQQGVEFDSMAII